MDAPVSQRVALAADASFPSVRLAAAALRGVLELWAVPEARRHALELALVEAMTNVVRHGYAGLPRGTFRLRLARFGAILSASLADRGLPFDPRAVASPPEPDPHDPSTWPEGGFGLPLIRSAADEISYESKGGENVLTLTLRLAPPSGEASA